MTAPLVKNRAADDESVITVLLVDDQRFVHMAVARLLASESDIRLHSCNAASEAVAKAIEVAPAVIFQDLVMPDGDGLALVTLFRSNPTTAGIPVVILSGNDDDATRTRAMAAGAVDYMVKLPSKAELLKSIRTLAGNRHPSPAGGPDGSFAPTNVTLDRRTAE